MSTSPQAVAWSGEKAEAQSQEVSSQQECHPYRLAVLASHPIQYQAPLFRELAANPEIDLTVFFCSDHGLQAYRDEGFGLEVKWDLPLMGGYHSEFLSNLSPTPNLSKFWGLINPEIMRRLRNGHFDAIIVHGWARFTNWLAMLTAFAYGIPVLVRGESNLLPSLLTWKASLKRWILTPLFKRVSGFLSIGQYNAEFYQAYQVPKEKVFHVPYAVNNDYFLSQAEALLPRKQELKQALGIPDEMPVILFSGKLIEVKRPLDLLKAFEALTKTHPAALIYLGDGGLKPQLEAYARKTGLPQVHFVGFQNQSTLSRFFALADIFVLPSSSEPWGLVVNEAMCFGLPVIVSDQVGAAGDLVREGVNGFVYPSGQVSALTAHLKLLVSDNARRQRMGEASRQLIERWSYREDVQGILECLAAL